MPLSPSPGVAQPRDVVTIDSDLLAKFIWPVPDRRLGQVFPSGTVYLGGAMIHHRQLTALYLLIAFATSIDVAIADEQLERAARSEGRVVIVGPSVGTLRDFNDAFQRKYGVRVFPLTARGPEMMARLDSEFASGQRQIGVFTTALSTMYLTQQAGRFESWNPPSSAGLPDRYREADNSFLAAAISPYGLLYNTKLVAPADRLRRGKTCSTPSGVEKSSPMTPELPAAAKS